MSPSCMKIEFPLRIHWSYESRRSLSSSRYFLKFMIPSRTSKRSVSMLHMVDHTIAFVGNFTVGIFGHGLRTFCYISDWLASWHWKDNFSEKNMPSFRHLISMQYALWLLLVHCAVNHDLLLGQTFWKSCSLSQWWMVMCGHRIVNINQVLDMLMGGARNGFSKLACWIYWSLVSLVVRFLATFASTPALEIICQHSFLYLLDCVAIDTIIHGNLTVCMLASFDHSSNSIFFFTYC